MKDGANNLMTSNGKMEGLLLFGFDDDIFRELCAQGARPKVWIKTGRKPGKEHIDGTTIYNHTPLKHGFVQARFSPEMDRDLAARVRREAYPYYLRNINRHERCRKVAGTSWGDKANRFEIMLNWYHAMLVEHDIRTLAFYTIPHGGSTIALYYLAREMGLQIILCYTLNFPDRFFMVEDITDIGHYRTSIRGDVKEDVQAVEEPVSPFYMDIDIPGHYSVMANRARLRWQLAKAILAVHFNRLTRHFGKEDKVIYRQRTVCTLQDRLDFLKLDKYAGDSFDRDRKYVYFPLHFQPELTSDVLGDIYGDQLLAIEELRRFLPDDIHIYIKENPLQSIYCREPSFFRRLEAIPGTTYLSANVSTFQLIENAWLVATLVGTAGWEAVQMGKPVITFGHAWYRCLGGVFDWSQGVNLAEIENFRFDRERLNRDVADMSRFFLAGLPATKVFDTQVKNFDSRENARKVTHAILEFIRTRSAGRKR